MSDPLTSSAPRPYRDRYVGLVCFGVLELLLGLMALLLLGSIALVTALAPKPTPGMEPRALIQAMLTYLAAAVFFLWMGIGSILARRWARALVLVASWLWLFSGVLACASFFVLFPRMQESMARSMPAGPGSPDASQVAGVVEGCTFVVLAVLFVAVPLALVLFYGRADVKATCEARDARSRWTDRCPLPVLGMSLLATVGAFSMLALAFGYRVLPAFGVIFTGWTALAGSLVVAALLAFIARASFRMEPSAWWAALMLWVVGAASSAITFLRPFDWQELYRQMGVPVEQYQRMGLGQFWEQRAWVWLVAASFVPTLAYLVWVRRFFAAPGDPRPLAQ